MSTSSDLKNQRNYILRKVGRNKKVLNISLPKDIVRKANIKPQDYLVITYEDKKNMITFRKLNVDSNTHTATIAAATTTGGSE